MIKFIRISPNNSQMSYVNACHIAGVETSDVSMKLHLSDGTYIWLKGAKECNHVASELGLSGLTFKDPAK